LPLDEESVTTSTTIQDAEDSSPTVTVAPAPTTDQ
jgi:hypothetical protein